MSYPRLGTPEFRNPRSFADWEAFLVAHRAPPSTREKPQFGGPWGYAMRKRWDWLQDALDRGIDYQAAEGAFDAVVDRERGEERASASEPNARAHRRATRDTADALLDHAQRVGL
jgi:hypothetical protein